MHRTMGLAEDFPEEIAYQYLVLYMLDGYPVVPDPRNPLRSSPVSTDTIPSTGRSLWLRTVRMSVWPT